MPLYRYKCGSCGSEFTVLVRQRSDGDDIVCPDCGSRHTQKVVSRVAIQFKGSGYYKTDYARRGKSQAGMKTSASSQPEDSARQEKSPSDLKVDSNKDNSESRKSQPSKSASKQYQLKERPKPANS